eukprot:8347807-Alexandrium_andersonii.AAC.1
MDKDPGYVGSHGGPQPVGAGTLRAEFPKQSFRPGNFLARGPKAHQGVGVLSSESLRPVGLAFVSALEAQRN